MTITLHPEHAQFVADQVAAGHFASPDDVLAEALDRLMADVVTTEEDLAAVAEGLEQSRRGEGIPWEQVRDALLAKYRGRNPRRGLR